MTQQALYDTKSSIVLQWQDTDKFSYGAAPSTASVLSVTATEWANQAGVWYVVSGKLTQTNPNAPTAAQLLDDAQSAQNAIIDAAYLAAVTTPVAFTTAAGVASTYQADPDSQQILSRAMQTYKDAGSVPSGFYWRSAGNTNVTFTLADLEGLDAAMMAQGWAAFQQKVKLKGDIAAATTVSAVQGVIWA
jgi:hypothetical protein